MIKANIGGDKFTTIKESWKYFYVFEALKIINDPTQDMQVQQYQRRPIQNKTDADRFATGFRKANYIAAKLIHDPVRYRAEEKKAILDKIRIDEEAKERAFQVVEEAKRVAKEKADEIKRVTKAKVDKAKTRAKRTAKSKKK